MGKCRRTLRAAAACIAAAASAAEAPERGIDPETGRVRSVYRLGRWMKLPLTFGLGGLLQQREPSAIVEPLDFGGLANSRLFVTSVEWNSWTGTRFIWNGLDVTDPYRPGRLVFIPDLSAVAEVVIDPEASRAGMRSYGPVIGMRSRHAEPEWHGGLSSWNTAGALAWTNLTPLARAGGVRRSRRYDWSTRDHAQIGGGLRRGIDVFFSGTGQWSQEPDPRAVASDIGSRLLFGNSRGRIRVSPRDRIDAGFSGSRIDRSGLAMPAGFEPLAVRRMAAPFAPHPSLGQEDHFDLTSVSWTRAAAAELQLRYGYSVAHLDTLPQRDRPEPGVTPQIDLLTGEVEGPAPLENLAVRTRHSTELSLRPRPAPRGHRLTGGAAVEIAAARNRWRAPSDGHILTFAGQPVTLVRLNTPLNSYGRTGSLTLFAHDAWRVHPSLLVSAGIEWDWSRGWLPEQTSPAGEYSPGHRFSSSGAVIEWSGLSPRAALVLAIPRLDRLRFRASYARTLMPLAARYLDFANPNSLSGQEYAPDAAATLLRRFGGEFSAIDDRLRRPYRDQFAVDAETSLPWGAFGRLRLFRSDEKRRVAPVNTGVPFSAYTPRIVHDLGGDGRPGTFDDRDLVLFDQDPSTFGRDFFLLTNPGLRMQNSGLTAEIGVNRAAFYCRFAFSAGKSFGPTSPGNAVWENDAGVVPVLFADPNALVNAAGRSFMDRAYLGKAEGWARAPARLGAWEVGAIFQYMDGLVFGRRLLVTGLSQGPAVIAATVRGSPEGGHRTQYHASWDIRVSRPFSIGPGTLQVAADVFNVLNASFSLVERDVSGVDFERRLPLAIQPPRSLRLGFDYRF